MTASSSTRDVERRLDGVVASDPRVDGRYVRLIDSRDGPVVGVFGVGHLDGIEASLKNTAE